MTMESLSSPAADDRREWRRYPAHCDVELTIMAGDQDRRCLVRDISLGGARLYCGDGLPDATEIMLEHPLAGRVSVQRLWRVDSEVGIQFDFSEAGLSFIAHCLNTMLGLDAVEPAVAGAHCT